MSGYNKIIIDHTKINQTELLNFGNDMYANSSEK